MCNPMIMLNMLGTNLKTWTALKLSHRIGRFQSGPDSFKTDSTASKQARQFTNLSLTALKPALKVSQLSMFKKYYQRGFNAQLVLCNVYGCTTTRASCSQSGQNMKATNKRLACCHHTSLVTRPGELA